MNALLDAKHYAFAPEPSRRRKDGWTDGRVELLKTLWADGLSAAQIAGELGAITRNAVIGKVHRLGLSRRADSPAVARSGRRSRRSRTRIADGGKRVMQVFDPEPPAPEPIADLAIPVEQRRTLLTLDESTCRWPVGDPRSAEFFFCGGPADNLHGAPYCAGHAGAAGAGYCTPGMRPERGGIRTFAGGDHRNGWR